MALATFGPAITKSGMWRRPVHVVLLFLGIAPCAWAASIITTDPRRAAVLLGVGCIGLALNGCSLAYPRWGMRLPLRIIAVGVGMIVLAAVMAMWQWIRGELLPETPPAATAGRELLQGQMSNLLWIAGSVVYVLSSLAIRPFPPRKVTPVKPKRIDFRTYGREKT